MRLSSVERGLAAVQGDNALAQHRLDNLGLPASSGGSSSVSSDAGGAA
jgi:hypothetical protein